jgi:alpha-tubulin suppressor-like RCC1 family protein
MVPRTVGEGLGFREITAGSSHTCGRTGSGNTFCWGANNRGQLGDGSSGLDRLTPTLVRTTVSGLVAGHEHTCGIADGRAFCWGANTFGQLGDGSTDDRSSPTPVEGLPNRVSELAAGALHSCALLTDGRLFCWGQNFAGQLGDGTTQGRITPVRVAGDLRFSEVHAGGAQTCAITTGGERYCWGLNQNGQLGDGTRVNRSTPTRVGG